MSTLSDPQYFVDGQLLNVVATPPLEEDDILFINQTRSNDVIGEQIQISLVVKMVSNGIEKDG